MGFQIPDKPSTDHLLRHRSSDTGSVPPGQLLVVGLLLAAVVILVLTIGLYATDGAEWLFTGIRDGLSP